MSDQSSQVVNEHAIKAMALSEIREIVNTDKTLAMNVVREAKGEIDSFRLIKITPDITGKPDGITQFNRYKSEQLRHLEAVTRSPFFTRFRAKMTSKGKSENIAILITEARDVGGAVFGDGWILTNWTTPLGIAIRGIMPGEQASVEVRWVTTYDVDSSSLYEKLLPDVTNGQFEAIGRRGVIATEDELVKSTTPEAATELAPVEYEAKATFGLNDIVVLVDKPQQAALGLPFDQSVVIDGPPGSGKTSVGIMRIAVLYDQQWDKLKLNRQSDKPFHGNSTMRILVYNEEMVEYLRSLAQSIGVSPAQVMTTKDFFKKICRITQMLSGTERHDRPSLSVLKSRRESLSAYFAGFKAHATAHWELHEDDFRQQLFGLGPDFLTLADQLSEWVERISRASVVEDRISGSIGIADSLTDEAEAIETGRSRTRRSTSPAKDASNSGDGQSPPLDMALVHKRMPAAQELVNHAVHDLCGRAGITNAMFDQPEYEALKEFLAADGVTARTIEAGDRLWKKQYKGKLPAYSEPDLAMSAWLGASLLLSVNPHRKPWIGGRQSDRLTHLVVDEAQDLSPSHLAVLASQLVNEGTMTLVGDIHQNLNPHAGLRQWQDAGLPNMEMTSFGVNHRQTRQLGEFVGGLYSGLFTQECRWEPSSKLVGALPRAGVARSWKQLTGAIIAEARYWREKIGGVNGATVAVLYDGKMGPKRTRLLQQNLEVALSDQLISVEVALPGSGSDPLRRTDRVIIASVKQTKGLEFDAVIFVEPRARWSKPAKEIDLRWRNGFYVATSRARAGLSMCMSNLPLCIEPLVEQGLCTRVEWKDEEIEVVEDEDEEMPY